MMSMPELLDALCERVQLKCICKKDIKMAHNASVLTVHCAAFFTVKQCFAHLWVTSVVFSITHWNTTHEVMNIHGWKVSVLCVFTI